MLMNFERKIITGNIPFGRVLKFDQTEGVIELFTIYYKDIRPGTAYNMFSSVSENSDYGELELFFQNETKFKQIVAELEVSPIAFEIYIHDNYFDLVDEQFNKFYFLDYDFYQENIAEGKKDMKLKAVDFIGAIEDKTICEHNVEYDFLSVDSEGEYIEPPNFNKIAFSTTIPYAIYDDLFFFNIYNPVNRVKGRGHVTELSRKPVGIGQLTNLFDFTVAGFDYVSEKKSLFKIRREINQILKNQNGMQELPNLEIRLEDKELRVYLVTKGNIVIDNFINKDRIISQTREKNKRDSVEDVLIESDKLDIAYYHKTRNRGNVWKQKERIESSSPDEGTEETPNDPESIVYSAPLETKADEVLGNGTPIDKAELEMNIKNSKYFDDLDTHAIIEVKNFDDAYNGLYRVDKISCVVEQTYLSYSLETITKINN